MILICRRFLPARIRVRRRIPLHLLVCLRLRLQCASIVVICCIIMQQFLLFSGAAHLHWRAIVSCVSEFVEFCAPSHDYFRASIADTSS